MSDQSLSSEVRLVAKDRVHQHCKWAHARERAFYGMKKQEAVSNPKGCMSLAIDGTQQMPYGMPHFLQKTKGDGTYTRVKWHTQIVLMHGSTPQVFLAKEDIAGDPNWTIDTLYRALRREEKRRRCVFICVFVFFFFSTWLFFFGFFVCLFGVFFVSNTTTTKICRGGLPGILYLQMDN
jgi:hypothetical protein